MKILILLKNLMKIVNGMCVWTKLVGLTELSSYWIIRGVLCVTILIFF